MSEPSTPLMRQYAAIKKDHPNALLFFRLGDFYELFFEDARWRRRELQITLTSRNKEKGIAVPMCGVPYHSAEGYIAKLIRKGFKVAICEQMEDPRIAKKLVKREVTRVVTPGTAADSQLGRRGKQLPRLRCAGERRDRLCCARPLDGRVSRHGISRQRRRPSDSRRAARPASARSSVRFFDAAL